MRQIILDTETTGLEPELGHRIVEIGAIVIKNRQITEEIFHAYLNPERESDPRALAVHGLSQDFLQDKPRFEEILDDFLRFLMPNENKNELIIHNAIFDIKFLNREIALCNQAKQGPQAKTFPIYKELEAYCNITDSLKLARKMHPNQRNSLDALCKRYDIDNSQRDLHGAPVDTRLLAQVYLKMTSGQGSFFDMLTNLTQPIPQIVSRVNSPTVFNLPICYANTEELKAHAEMLASIRDKAGICLWEEE